MSNRIQHPETGSEYAIVRTSDKAYMTDAGGFSPDRRKARQFTTFDLAQQAVRNMRVITNVSVSRLDLFGYGR